MVWKEPLLDKLQRKFGRYAVHGLMTWIVGITAAVWLLSGMVRPVTGLNLISLLSFNRALILRGQIWRLFTFAFIPAYGSVLSLLLSLYFYWLIGTSLEAQWGKFRFNLYYLTGILGSAVSGMITGSTTAVYLNMSLFLAYAILNPDFELLLFFILPVKIKWLAILDAVGLAAMLLTDSIPGKLALIFSLINLILFFYRDAIDLYKNWKRRREWRKNWK